MLLPAFFIMKICTKCGIEKEEGEFGKHVTGKNGLRSECKVCGWEYSKSYYQNNIEKVKERIIKYRQNNPEKLNGACKKYRQNNPEKIKEARKKHYQYNTEKVKEESKKHYQNNTEKVKEAKKKYYQNNPEKLNAACKKYRQNNPEKVKEKSKKAMLGLSDSYVAMTIRGNSFKGWKIEDIPKELIDLKRNAIKLKREIKTKQNDNSATNL
jgi:transketolase